MRDPSGHYILLDDHSVKRVPLLEWARWFDKAERHVADTHVGDVRISTVFLGLDHSFLEGSEPILFETMIFGGDCDEYCQRYHTWDEAETGHKECVEAVQSGQCKEWM